VTQIMSETGKKLSELVGERMRLFPASGEINRRVPDSQATLAAVRDRYVPGAVSVDMTDGLSVEFPEWRFNLRVSNTEPLIRLNVETRGQPALMRARTDELLAVIGGEAG
jgi:phosphomannomutase